MSYPSREVREFAQQYLMGEFAPRGEKDKKLIALGLIASVVPEHAFEAWLDAPHPDLGGRTPRSVIDSGHADAVITMVANAIRGIPS
ncbi:MAG: MbcA/ParS/Xre antitoxin family protein [Patescibacteria group bacterium]